MSGIVGGAGSKSGIIGQTELDYEEGTWTPVFKSGGNTMSLSSGTLTGNYVKVGGICQFTAYLNNGTITGTAVNSDTTWSLPFTNRGIEHEQPYFSNMVVHLLLQKFQEILV